MNKRKNRTDIIYILALFLLLPIFQACGESPEDSVTEQYPLGLKTWDEWKKEAGWNSYEGNSYEPDKEKAIQINGLAKNPDVVFYVFSGAWCSDSESEVPKMFKLFKEANLDMQKIKLYGVDRNKAEPSGTSANYSVDKVPTLLIVNGGVETGRIIEYPRPGLTWEDEIIMILSK